MDGACAAAARLAAGRFDEGARGAWRCGARAVDGRVDQRRRPAAGMVADAPARTGRAHGARRDDGGRGSTVDGGGAGVGWRGHRRRTRDRNLVRAPVRRGRRLHFGALRFRAASRCASRRRRGRAAARQRAGNRSRAERARGPSIARSRAEADVGIARTRTAGHGGTAGRALDRADVVGRGTVAAIPESLGAHRRLAHVECDGCGGSVAVGDPLRGRDERARLLRSIVDGADRTRRDSSRGRRQLRPAGAAARQRALLDRGSRRIDRRADRAGERGRSVCVPAPRHPAGAWTPDRSSRRCGRAARRRDQRRARAPLLAERRSDRPPHRARRQRKADHHRRRGRRRQATAERRSARRVGAVSLVSAERGRS